MSLNSIFLEQNCNFILTKCNLSGAAGENCATEFCYGFPSTSGTCPQIGLDPNNCCGSSDPAACLNTWVHNGGGGGGAAANPCASVVSMLDDCLSAYPTLFPSSSIYTQGPYATNLASCLCYEQDGTYDTVLDDFAATCVESGSAAHPTYYKFGTLMEGFCTNNAGPAAVVASITTTSPAGSSAHSSAGSTATATAHSAASTASASSAAGVSTAAAASSTSTASATTTTTSKSSAIRIKKPFHTAAIGLFLFSMIASLY